MPKPMSEAEARERLKRVPGWELEGARLQRTYSFDSYTAGVEFANRVAGLAEQANHHPDILIGYRKVTLTLTSHDAGGLTSRDFDMAARVDAG